MTMIVEKVCQEKEFYPKCRVLQYMSNKMSKSDGNCLRRIKEHFIWFSKVYNGHNFLSPGYENSGTE